MTTNKLNGNGRENFLVLLLHRHSSSAGHQRWPVIKKKTPKNKPGHDRTPESSQARDHRGRTSTAVGRVREAADEQRPKDDFDYEFYFLHCPQFGPASTVNLAPHILGNEVEQVGFGLMPLLVGSITVTNPGKPFVVLLVCS